VLGPRNGCGGRCKLYGGKSTGPRTRPAKDGRPRLRSKASAATGKGDVGHPHRREVDTAFTKDITLHDAYSPKLASHIWVGRKSGAA
jgi:hypothetical protein